MSIPGALPAGSNPELRNGVISYSCSIINGSFKLVWKFMPASLLVIHFMLPMATEVVIMTCQQVKGDIKPQAEHGWSPFFLNNCKEIKLESPVKPTSDLFLTYSITSLCAALSLLPTCAIQMLCVETHILTWVSFWEREEMLLDPQLLPSCLFPHSRMCD